MHRRRLLQSLGALVVTSPAVASAAECLDPTPPMVAGPFPPASFRPELGGRTNPGAWRPVAEHDLDLSRVSGVESPARGQVVALTVAVVDARCRPVSGAKVELWQADAAGYYNHRNETRVSPEQLDPGFGYWASGQTDEHGRLTVRTVVPGAYPASSTWWRPPHVHWSVRAEGHADLTTQTYFDGDVLVGVADIRAKNGADHILHFREGFDGGLRGASLKAARRVATEELVARFVAHDDGVPRGSVTLRLGG